MPPDEPTRAEEDLEIAVGDDGRVTIHVPCPPGGDASECARRAREIAETLEPVEEEPGA